MYTSQHPKTASGLRPIGLYAARIVADLRFRRHAIKVHSLGQRATLGPFAEIAARWDKGEVDAVLSRYAELDPDDLHKAGGDRLPPQPIRGVA